MKYLLTLLVASAILLSGCTNQDQVFCTADAKICPDGTSVGRNSGNNCEFDPCKVEVVTSADQCEGGETATCENGKQYTRWNVVDGKCFQINYLVNPCEDLSGGRVMQLTQDICKQAGGNWNECGSPCAGTGQDFCILSCEQQCECGGFAGFRCPAGYECRLSGRIADEMGKCIPKNSV